MNIVVFDDRRITLLSTVRKIACKLIEMNEFCLTETQLLGNSLFNLEKNLRMSGLNNRSTEKKTCYAYLGGSGLLCKSTDWFLYARKIGG